MNESSNVRSEEFVKIVDEILDQVEELYLRNVSVVSKIIKNV